MAEVPSSRRPIRRRAKGRKSPARSRARTPAEPASPSEANTPIPRRRGPTRLSVPRLAPDQLPRSRLVNLLHENIHRKLILISAAAGYGKSALLAEFAAQTDYPVVWLRLEETDRDLATLITDLVSALRLRFAGYTSEVPRLAAQPGAAPADLATALTREIGQSLDEYFVLVLDDFHLIETEADTTAFFNTLLDQLPEQAHLIIAGRTVPKLRYPRLAARQQIAGLSEEHLRFRSSEVQDLLKLRNRVDMPAAAADSLVANTEGWITGILLTTHLMWQGLMANLIEARQSNSPLFDYLATEVLDQQPQRLRQFLLESAVLPEMEPNTCDEVLGCDDSAELLEQAESHRLFVNVVGDEFRAYQYHHLFRDFLQNQLRADDPARLKAIQARAAEWYLANDMPEAAVTYYVLGGQLAQAATLAEAHCRAMRIAGRHATLRRWAEQLAPVAGLAPGLHVHLATADIDAGELARAEQELAVADDSYSRSGDRAGLLEVGLRRAWSLIRQNQYPSALGLARPAADEAKALGLVGPEALALRYAGKCLLALGQASEAEPALLAAVALFESIHQPHDLALALHELASAYRLRGRTTRAAAAQHQALAIMRAESAVGPLANLLNDIGWDLHMLGQYESALATYTEAMDCARRGGSAYGELMVMAGQADVLADLGEAEQAGALFHQALAKAEAGGEWAMSVYLQCALARQDRRAGNSISALEWLRRAEGTANGRPVTLPLTNIEGLRGVVLLEIGRLDEGRRILQEASLALELAEAPVDLAQTLLFRAQAEFVAGDTETAAGLVGRALAVAEAVGYDQMLLTEAARLADMLEACRAWPELEPRLTALLARAGSLAGVRARLAERGIIASHGGPAAAAARGLEVRAMGTGQVFKEGAEIARTEWRSQRPRELFFYLIGRVPVGREEVLATFWPEMDQSRAVANLHQTMYRLRRALGTEVVVLDENGFHLAPGLDLRVDATQFEAQARAALGFTHSDLRRLGALETALALYTGDYLADVTLDWAVTHRHGLRELYVRLLSEYADELLSYTRYADARVALERALLAEPLRDDLHGRMLVCLAALGRRHEVVDHYRRYRETLRTELGLDPPPEMRSLYARLIA